MPTIKARAVERGGSRSKSPVLPSSSHHSNPKPQSSPREPTSFLSNPAPKDVLNKPAPSMIPGPQLEPSPSSKSFKRPEQLGLVNPLDNSRSRSRLKILQAPGTNASPSTAASSNTSQPLTSSFLAPGQRKPSSGLLAGGSHQTSVGGLSHSAMSSSGHHRHGSDAFSSPTPQQNLHNSGVHADSANVSTISKPMGQHSQASNGGVSSGAQQPNYSTFLKKISNIRQKKGSELSTEPKGREDSFKPSVQLAIPKHPTMGHSRDKSASPQEADKENNPRPANVSSFCSSLGSNSLKKDTLKKGAEEAPTKEAWSPITGLQKVGVSESTNHVSAAGQSVAYKSTPETPAPQTLVQDEPLSSKNIFSSIPDIQSKDTMGFKIEALRFYLEKKMGLDHLGNIQRMDRIGLDILLAVYRTLIDASENEDKPDKQGELPIMSAEQEKFVPFVHQLVYCELNYYSV